MKKRKKVSMFDIVVNMIAVFLVIIVLYPMIWVLSCSFSDPSLVGAGKVILLPKGFNLNGYIYIFQDKNMMIGYANSFYYTIFGTLFSLFLTLPAGYVLSMGNKVPGNNLFTGLMMFTMYFGGGLIPSFLLKNSMGLYNTRAVIILTGAFSVFNTIVCRSFFAAIPDELEEAAEIDGCSYIRIFAQIIMPISKALTGVMTLYYGVGVWNSYFTPMIYLRDDSKKPLQVFLKRIVSNAADISGSSEELGEMAAYYADIQALVQYSSMVVAAVPLLVLYPFLQKYFEKGVLVGSVKG